MEYYGIKKGSKLINILLIVLIGLFILYGVIDHSSGLGTYIICIILILVVAFSKTIMIVNDKGVDSCLSVFGFKIHGVWKWQDLSYMLIDYRKSKTEVTVHFTKRKVKKPRTVVLSADCIEEVANFAAKKNPRIMIETRGENDLNIKGRQSYRKADYDEQKRRAKKAADPDSSFNLHEIANEARKIKAEREQKNLPAPADEGKLTVAKPSKSLGKKRY